MFKPCPLLFVAFVLPFGLSMIGMFFVVPFWFNFYLHVSYFVLILESGPVHINVFFKI